MKRWMPFFGMLIWAAPAAAQWTEGGARIGASLDTLAVTFQGMGTLFYLTTFGDAGDLYIADTAGNARVSLWGEGFSGGGQLNLSDASGAVTIRLVGGAPGNTAVIFPAGAISAMEIANEAGVVSSSEGVNSVSLSGTGRDTLLAQSIVAPDTGFLLIIGSAQATLNHTNGVGSSAEFGLLLDATSPSTQDVALRLGPAAPTESYAFPIAVQMIIPVSAGTHDIVFWGSEFGGDYIIWDMQLSVVYLPTAYGTVAKLSTQDLSETRAPARTSSLPIHEIRAESEAANRARIQAELARIRAQLEALEQAMEPRQASR